MAESPLSPIRLSRRILIIIVWAGPTVDAWSAGKSHANIHAYTQCPCHQLEMSLRQEPSNETAYHIYILGLESRPLVRGGALNACHHHPWGECKWGSMNMSYFKWFPLQVVPPDCPQQKKWSPRTVWSRKVGLPRPFVAAALSPPYFLPMVARLCNIRIQKLSIWVHISWFTLVS